MAMRQLVVLGGGGNAKDALDTIQQGFEVVAFIDDDVTKQNTFLQNIPVLPRTALADFPDAQVVSLIGSEKTFAFRDRLIDDFGVEAGRFATIIHPSASVSKYASIGHDVVIFAGVSIPSNAKIGNHVFILPNTVIHHDTIVEDYAVIGSGVVIAGHVRIGRNSFIGSGSSIKNDVDIGDYSLVGMAANVIRNCEPRSVLVGNPARAHRGS